MASFQLQNRGEMRRIIGRSLGIMQTGEATSTTDSNSLIDTLYLHGADDEVNGRQVVMYDNTGSIVDGEISFVSDFTGSSSDATVSPTFTAAITDGDLYEMWKFPWLKSDVDAAIDEAIIAATPYVPIDRVTDSNFTQVTRYEYDWLVPYAFGNDFTAVHTIEHVTDIGTNYEIHDCDTVWDELVDGDVTASVDTSIQREGNGCLKLVVAAGCAAGDILATQDISSLDITGCDSIEIWIYSTTALDAGDLQVLLSATALCASPLEELDIPATSANTCTRHVLSMENAPNDSAIISVGIKMITDKGAFTLYADDIRATLANSKVYKELNPAYWAIVRGTTPKLRFTSTGLSIVGTNTQVRISGYSSPDIFSDDATDSEVDPEYIINYARGVLLTGRATNKPLDIDNREKKGNDFLALALQRLNAISKNVSADTRSVT